MIFSVAYRPRKYISNIERVNMSLSVCLSVCISLYLSLSLYIYISSSCIIFSRSVLRYIVIHRVGDNGRTVNTSTSPHISDQLGTENACLTLLCWFIVMIWIWFARICIDMNVIWLILNLSTTIQLAETVSVAGKRVNTDFIEKPFFILKYNDREKF